MGVSSFVFWQPVFLILRWRIRVAVRSCTRSAPTLLALTFALILGCPASYAAARLCDARLHAAATASEPSHLAALVVILFAIQAVFLALRLPKAGFALNHSVPLALLHPYALRSRQIVVADVLADLVDIPTLLALPALIAVVRQIAAHGPAGVVPESMRGLSAGLILTVLLLQTASFSRLIQIGRQWIFTGAVRVCVFPVVLLVAVACVLLLSCLATIAAPTQTGALGAATPPSALWIHFTPPGLAAEAASAIWSNQPVQSVLWSVGLCASFCATLTAADFCVRRMLQPKRSVAASAAGGSRPLTPHFRNAPLSTAAAVAGAEWRCLLRDGSSYLPLRGPATLLFTLCLVWLLANNGNDPLLNLRDLGLMSAILYIAICQLQLLCNRFGNDADRARILFSLPMPRHLLFIGKNIALMSLLLPLDCGLAGLACLSAQAAPRLAAATLAGFVGALGLLTAIGNVVSVIAPFPIARADDRFHPEPDRVVLFVYIVALTAAFAPACAVPALEQVISAPLAVVAVIIILTGMYTASLFVAERLLVRGELRVLAALEGKPA